MTNGSTSPLSVFLVDLAQANEFLHARALRRYQHEILSTGILSLRCPFSGFRLHAKCSVALPEKKAIYYRFDSEIIFWLGTTVASTGFPLGRMILPDPTLDPIRDAVQSNELIIEYNQGLFHQLESLNEYHASEEVSFDTTTPCLVIGHPNFAHHLWNELSAVDAWLEGVLDSELEKIRLCCLCEPLVPIASIFPKLKNVETVQRSLDQPQVSSASRGLLTRLGSTQVSASIRRKLVDSISRSTQPEVVNELVARIATRWPVVAITIRTDGRTADNQGELLSLFLKKFFSFYESGAVVFDGFSYPQDVSRDTYQSKRVGFDKRARDAKTFIESLVEALKPEQRLNCVNGAGLSIVHSLMLCSHADYYISYSGTTQHKFGWVLNLAGYILCGHNEATPFAQKWHQDQVEKGVMPAIVQQRWVENTSPSDVHSRSDRNWNYHVNDIEALTQDILEKLGQSLER